LLKGARARHRYNPSLRPCGAPSCDDARTGKHLRLVPRSIIMAKKAAKKKGKKKAGKKKAKKA
jgi:hypothetical protein